MQSIFHNLPNPPVDDVAELWQECVADPFPQKISFVTGAFYAADSELWASPLVQKIEKALAGDGQYGYLFPYGLESLRQASTKLLMGENSLRKEQTVFAIQSAGGCGALYLGLDFLMKVLKRNVVYTSDPSWDNYVSVLRSSGFLDTRTYRYWHAKNRCVDFEGMCEDLNNAPENAVIILQVNAHNPTGCDPTREQWMEISNIVKKRRLFAFFDSAYLGFSSGDPDVDAWPVRYFASQGHELFCALSYSKTFALYGSRVGCLVTVTNDKESAPQIMSHIMPIIRGTYMTPPIQGARIVDVALNTPQYMEEWRECIRRRHERIVYLRKCLRERLEARTRPGLWKCITDQSGLFAYVGLPADVVRTLKDKYHIYIPNMPLGRINVPSVTENNIDYFADALVETLTEHKSISLNQSHSSHIWNTP